MKHFSRKNRGTQGENKVEIWIKQPLNDNFVKSDSFPEQVLEKSLRICYNIGVSSAHTYSIRNTRDSAVRRFVSGIYAQITPCILYSVVWDKKTTTKRRCAFE